MPLQTSGTAISLSQIQTEYGGANNLSISEYYNGGPNTTPNVLTSRISKIIMKGVSGTTDGNADIREFEFDGLGDWGIGDRRTGNNEITISTNMNTISDPNSNTEPHLNTWINGSKELDTPDSRFLVGQVTINSNYYIEFEFVGNATKPLVNDFNKLKIYWDKSDISLDGDMGVWEICVYNEDGMQLSYGNITLTENNIVSDGSSILSTYESTNLYGQTSYSITFSQNTICEILIIAGGGAGGKSMSANRGGGGGGAGGLIYTTSIMLAADTYTLKVGNGGLGNSMGTLDGNSSSISSSSINYLAYGGGGGGSVIGGSGSNGGSGGGGADYNGLGGEGGGGGGISQSHIYGFNGGRAYQPSGYYQGGSGGGGGGAGGLGQYANSYTLGNGGSGKNINITGTLIEYAKGGDGGSYAGGTGKTGENNKGNGGGGAGRNETQKGGSGGSGIIIIRYFDNVNSYYLEFNLGTPLAIASGGYVSGVSYIPTYSQPYTAISFSDFYYQATVGGPPNPPNPTTHPGRSGGVGNTSYELIRGLYANNTSRTEGTTTFDNRGATGRSSSNDVKYQNLIIQAKPGDVLNLIGNIYVWGSYFEYCEFWVWLGSSWFRFSSPSANISGSRDFSVYYTIPSNTPAGNYALAVACSYASLGATQFRSWKSYSLEVWT